VLEVGCGAGDLLLNLSRLGYEGVGLETSEAARQEAERRTRPAGGRVRIAADVADADGCFDLVVACEVLEHIEDDRGALAEWVARLAPGGHVLVSVPAHRRRWSDSDVWAGHYRRYERNDLRSLLEGAGLLVDRIGCYGFPVANLVEPLRNRQHRRRLASERGMSVESRSARSGIERSRLERATSFLVTSPLFLPGLWMQVPFMGTELGTGYLALARLRGV
jgi:SAM-dependent methyltransferase